MSSLCFKELNENWPVIFRALRNQLGATQYDFSRFSGISQSTISKIELGKRQPSFRGIRDIAHLLGLSIEELASGRFSYNPKMERAFKLFGLKSNTPPSQFILSRAMMPILEFILKDMGDKRITELLNHVGIKEDIFVFKDYKIDIKKFQMLCTELIDNKIIQKEHFRPISEMSFSPEMYGEKHFKSMCSATHPLSRFHIHYNKHKSSHLENFSKITYKRVSRTNALIKRVFRTSVEKNTSFGHPASSLGLHLWCHYFKYHLESFVRGTCKSTHFNIYKSQCQWQGDECCLYELQVD